MMGKSVFKNIRIVTSEQAPSGEFVLVSETDEPCPHCGLVPTLHFATGLRSVRSCQRCERQWDFKRTDTPDA